MCNEGEKQMNREAENMQTQSTVEIKHFERFTNYNNTYNVHDNIYLAEKQI